MGDSAKKTSERALDVSLLFKNISLPLADFTLEADVEIQNPVTAIFGPSGAEKTSVLDLIAGLRRPRSALIRLGDRVLTNTANGINVPTRLRQIGYVPQDLSLFPHLSAEQNLRYGYTAPRQAGSLFSYEHVTDVLEIQALGSRAIH